MLVLSRKLGEKVWIGDAEVEVVRCGNGGVRLGIKAPVSTRIRRSELPDDPQFHNDAGHSLASNPHLNNESRKAEGPLAAELAAVQTAPRRAG